ncbi:MAG: hypothetical protein ACYTFK_09700, partial [Planctomycetota bacterium]
MIKTKLAFALVLVFSGITSAQNVPACITVCPPDAGVDETITLTAYDEFGDKVDLSEFDGVEVCFEGSGDPYCFIIDSGDFDAAIVDGTSQFTLIERFYNHNRWTIGGWGPFDWNQWLAASQGLVDGCDDCGDESTNWPPEYRLVADAVAGGGTCESQSCGAGPLPDPIIITPNVMTVYEEGETEGDFGVSLGNQPPSGDTITVTVDPNNGGPSEDIALVGGSGPNGSVALTFNSGNWNVPQTVLFNAIDDDIAEPNDQPQLLEEHTIHLVSSYPGHPTDANFVGEEYLTATVVDNDIPRETLYNGIVLPPEWPPRYGSVPYAPMPVPYLDSPPAVVTIDVGRQLFVDDFLIDTTDMTQTYHQADYYTAGNPVLTPTTVEEHGPEGNMMAGPFSGGAWYDSADNLFKMWYRGGMSGVHPIQSQLYATSTDGKNWDRPKLDVNPVGLLENFTCTPSNP